ncbi:PREDICTED: uncharacterized protein LOC107349020 [Acropora digitifera]|uniref:uncharacterized protein LOC107349020 n=2 Tax=Acropora digitifera TaxID=70779 RepID=UPI00077AD88C|nr:PREDICTED: uncharacterized protein LOC107349020 [Acropora digitifera]
MPKSVNCCVPGCTNNFRNNPGIRYYRIPKDEKVRRRYEILIRNATLKVKSDNTRICEQHFEGGIRKSRYDLPSIFPWSKPASTRRVLKRFPSEEVKKSSKKSRRALRPSSSAADSRAESELNIGLHLATNEQDGHTDFCGPVRDKEAEESQTNEMQTHVEFGRQTYELQKVESGTQTLEPQAKVEFGAQTELINLRFDIDQYKEKDSDIAFYTGFPNYKTLMLCYDIVKDSAKNISFGSHERRNFDCPAVLQPGRPRALTTFQEFILVLMRLRLGLFEKDLAHRFRISESTVSIIFRTWIRFLRLELQELILIPPRDVLQEHMPKIFKEFYPNTVVVIDCTEVQMERPSALDNQSSCYSTYKSRPTMKSLVGITPSGVVGFVSELYPGSTTDKEITVKSGFLKMLEQGDEVMADKGFLIQDELAGVGATLTIPVFLKGKQQFSKEEVEKNKKVASLRVHVERCMERIKNWHILDRPIPVCLAGVASDIFIVIAALTNFHPPLIS